MATRYAADEAEIRRLIDRLIEAIRTADLAGLEPIFADDVVSYDVASPLRDLGAEAKRRNWAYAFEMFEHPLGYEIRDVTVTVGDGVAFVYGLGRLSGTMRSGEVTSGFWVRWTAGLRKIDGAWRIAHDQVSVPVDPVSLKAMVDLQP